jgi:hypothetical protein
VLENLTLIAVAIIVIWLGAIAFYFYTSRQQRAIKDDLESLRAKLDELEDKNN